MARFQNQYYPDFFGENYKQNIAYNRDKLTLRYRINYYLVPYVWGEIFYPLNNPHRNKIDRIRGNVGFYYIFNDHLRSEWYYTIAQELNQKNKKTVYAAGMAWYYRF